MATDRSTAAHTVALARHAGGLTQRALAARAGLHQPNLAAVESGRRDATFSTVAQLVASSGSVLCVVPAATTTVAEVANDIRQLLERDEPAAFRAWLGLSDELRSRDRATCVAIAVTPPLPCGDDRYDALIAALVEHWMRRRGLPVPRWVSGVTMRSQTEWWIEDIESLHDLIRTNTPPAFARRNIYIDRSELESV